MNYKTNEQGDVAVRDSKGNLKYISKKLAMDSQLMKAMHFEIVEAPIAFEVEQPVVEEPIVVAPIEEETPKVEEVLTSKSKDKKTK